MAIKCYLYSNRTRQINHKYYSLSTDRDVRLFLDLKQDTAYFGKIENKAFVYEVEVEPEDVIECAYSYLKATAFRIRNRVDFRTVANAARREALKGNNKFEYIEDEPIDRLVKRKNFYQMLANRKLTQKQFEEYCEYKMNHIEESVLSALAVSVGYKILPKYKKLFYPYVIYQDPELVKDIILNEECSNFAIKLFFDKGYKIMGIDYENGRFNVVKNTKSIFMKDEYKYI